MDRPVLKYAFRTLRIVPYIQVCTIQYGSVTLFKLPSPEIKSPALAVVQQATKI